jgi:hypothetical protein
MSDPPVAETSTWQHTTLARGRHPCPRQDSNPTASERPQTDALRRVATGIPAFNIEQYSNFPLFNLSNTVVWRGFAAVRLLGLWVRIRRGHGCLSLVSVVCCQVEVSSTGRSLIQRRPTECDVCECDREASIMTRPWPTRSCCAIEKKILLCMHGDWRSNITKTVIVSFFHIKSPYINKTQRMRKIKQSQRNIFLTIRKQWLQTIQTEYHKVIYFKTIIHNFSLYFFKTKINAIYFGGIAALN